MTESVGGWLAETDAKAAAFWQSKMPPVFDSSYLRNLLVRSERIGPIPCFQSVVNCVLGHFRGW